MPLDREALLDVVEENPEELWKLIDEKLPGAWYRRDDRIRVMSTPVAAAFFNGPACCRLTDEEADRVIAETIEEMRQTGLPWVWQVGPRCTPTDLESRLERFGLQLSYEIPALSIDLRKWTPGPVPEGFQVQDVNDSEAYEVFASVGGKAFNLPTSIFEAFSEAQTAIGFAEDAAVRNVIGFAEGVPVACGTVFYGRGIAGIYTIGTLSEARGKGYGRAITEACMSRAIDRGMETAFLQASKMGYPIYAKIGFQEVCRFKALALPSPDNGSKPVS